MANHIRASHSLLKQCAPLCGPLTVMLWMRSLAATASRNGCPHPAGTVERCNFAASYQLSASVNNIIKCNQRYIKHYVNAHVPHAGLDVVTLCCLSSWITHPDPQIPLPLGKSALFVYLQGWVISNNHSSQDWVPRLSLSSRSSLALKYDLNTMHAQPRLAAILHRQNTQQTGSYFNSFYLWDTKHQHSAVVLFISFSMHEMMELG